jgi:hypothetical protein
MVRGHRVQRPDAHYFSITDRFHDHTSTDRTITGEQLMRDGLQVTPKLPNSSELIFLEPTPQWAPRKKKS